LKQGAFFLEKNKPSSNFVGLEERSPKLVLNLFLVSLELVIRVQKRLSGWVVN
jgi:hypothetical protein